MFLFDKNTCICHVLRILSVPWSSQMLYPKIFSTSPAFKMPLQVKFKFCVRHGADFFYVDEVFVANVFLIALETLRHQRTLLKKWNYMFLPSLNGDFLHVQYNFSFWPNETIYVTSFVSLACWKLRNYLWQLFSEMHFIFSISTALLFQAPAYTYQTPVFCIGSCIFS